MKVKMNWFLIPCTDMDRAVKFYNTIFNIKLDMVEDPSGDEMAMFSDPNDMTGLN